MQSFTQFDPRQEPLKTRLHRAKQLCFKLNQLSPDQKKQRKLVLSALLPNVSQAWIEPTFHCSFGDHIIAPDGLYINHNVTILDGADIIFGKGVLVGPHSVITATTHPKNAVERANGMELAAPIIIEDDVWIGANATILPGVTIGAGAIIAAGATVARDIAPKTTFIR